MSSLPAGARADAFRLGLVSLATSAVATRGFGQYSDDWNFFGQLDSVQGSSILARMTALFGPLPARPLQGLAHAVLHRALGSDLAAHYAVIALLDLAIVLVLHRLILRAGGVRGLALAVSLIYIALPHATTARWWISTLSTPIALLLALVALHAARRVGSAEAGHRGLPVVATAGASLAAAFAYEIPLPLLALAPILAASEARHHPGVERRRAAFVTGSLAVALPVIAAFLYKRAVSSRGAPPAEPFAWGRYILHRIFEIGYGELGRDLPRRAAAAIGDLGALDLATVAMLTLFAVWGLGRATGNEEDRGRRRLWWLAMLAGPPLYLLGYLVAFVTTDLGLSDVGLDNRTAVAAAIGIAFAFAGLAGGVAGFAPRGIRSPAISVAVAAVFALALLVTLRAADDWRAAARAQDRVVTAVRAVAPRLPANGARLLIDGACPYVGPAPVFERRLDTSRMLQSVLGDPAAEGDVLRPGSTLDAGGFSASAYAVPSRVAYGPGLFVLDVPAREIVPLPDATAAAGYLAAHPASSLAACPPSREGQGVLPARRR